jgi:hypothetical protein
MNKRRSPRLSSTSTKRSVAARKNGIYGGQERASRYEHVILSEWASWRGKAVLERYGPEYFKELRKRRKHYPKYSESPVIQTSPRVLAGKTMAEKQRTHYSRGYITRRTQDRIREEAIQHAKTEKNWAIAELWKAVAKTWEQ